ncbi:hypothetical protein BJ741DRAFT_662567 [Chytriomyces cf. hyalinus JEL632]|nr:hypothetical protein BJ741DRAFT_662567 [Chytriomyces cf. hyalinus JEL632]
MSKDGTSNDGRGWLNSATAPQTALADESGPFGWIQWDGFDSTVLLPLMDPLLLLPVGMVYDSASQSRVVSQLEARNYHIPKQAIEPKPTSSGQPQPFRETSMVSSADAPVSDPERKYKCLDCGNGFKTSSALRHHSYTHTKERPFICNFEDCRKSYTTNNRL